MKTIKSIKNFTTLLFNLDPLLSELKCIFNSDKDNIIFIFIRRFSEEKSIFYNKYEIFNI